MFIEDDFAGFTPEDIHELSLPYESADSISARLVWDDMDADWQQRLIEKGNAWTLRGSNAVPEQPDMFDMVELRDVLLGFGGNSVCFVVRDEDLEKILDRGILWDGADAEMMPGRPSQCHMNSAYCWDANRDKVTIATGYALSSDGMWRQHSWCIAFDEDECPYIVETTEPRVAYYGFPMTYSECEIFFYENE